MDIKVLVVHPDGTQEVVTRSVEDEFWESREKYTQTEEET